jgi:hypothetical protein
LDDEPGRGAIVRIVVWPVHLVFLKNNELEK